jgi:long-chain acyl-CoA synthetase
LGDSRQSYCLALVIPDPEYLLPWAKEQGLAHSDSLESLCKDPAVKDMLLKSIKTQGKAAGLFGFEIPKKIFLSHEVMTPENGLLTPSLKTKRHYVKKVFAQEIDACYAEGL